MSAEATPYEYVTAFVTTTACDGHIVVRVGPLLVAVLHDAAEAAALVIGLRAQVREAMSWASEDRATRQRALLVDVVTDHYAAWKGDPTPRGQGHREAAELIYARFHGRPTDHLGIAPLGADETPPRDPASPRPPR